MTVGEPLSQGSGDIAAPLGKFAPHRVEGVGSAATGLRVVVRRAAGVVGEFDSGLWPDLYAAYGASARLLNPTMELVGDMGFEIRGLPLGEAIELRFSELGFAPVVLQLDPLTAGERRELGKVRFTKGVTMSGTVRDESGAPIEGAHVVASGDGARGEAVTDAEGRFRVPNLRRDVRRIGVAADGYVKRIQWLTEGAALDGVAITLTTGGIVAGRLLDADGEPAAMGEDCLLAVRRRDDTETEFGSFVFEDAASEFRLRLEPGKYFLAIVSWKGGKLTEVSRHAFEIREGETTKLDVALK